MRILLCYFSATGNTAAMAQPIRRQLTELGAEVDELDITPPANRTDPPDLTSYQALIVGAPIHSLRAPRVVRQWLAGLKGQGQKAAMFFTYGGFQIHPTHYNTWQILKENGFTVVASAEFPGKHTFNLGGWEAMADRPDDSDFTVAREYADRVYQRFTGEDKGLVPEPDHGLYTGEQLDQAEFFRFKVVSKLPTRDGEDCSMCGLCEDVCPTGAMDAQQGRADSKRCIVCLGCVYHCPENALKINDLAPVFINKMKMEGETAETLRNKKSRLYF